MKPKAELMIDLSKKVLYALITLVFLLGCERTCDKSATTFSRVASSSSKIDFRNDVTADVSTMANLFDFDYFYNGAGVGVADINNDGLKDIFFCGNQVENRLYLNKGNLEFEDITLKSGINTGKRWANGVTFVDINGDGWLDIYVSQGGPNEKADRSNVLLINKGDLTFGEAANEYGLADNSISTQSAFFDYDKDGDLDCVVMNENPFYGFDPVSFRRILLQNPQVIHESSSHLYRNDKGKFVDVTIESGMLKPTFGLGLVVSDINGDGWLDIYFANDYYLPDNLYINNGQGFFVDQAKDLVNQVAFFGMGADVADVNNDLVRDIFVLDMAARDHKNSKTLMASMDVDQFRLLTEDLGFQHQYMFNSLQLGSENGYFDNIIQMGKMAKTDWSWAVLMNDFDNDADKDIFITNGYRRYAVDNDFKMKVNEAKRMYRGNVPLHVKDSLYELMPTGKTPNVLFENLGNMKFEEGSASWGLEEPTFSNGSTVADLDNDGDLDVVINNMDQEAFLYENQASERENANYLQVETIGLLSEAFAVVKIYHSEIAQMSETKRVRGYMSSVDNTAHFGLGTTDTVDSVVVEWPSGKKQVKYAVRANQRVTFLEKDSSSYGEQVDANSSLPMAIELKSMTHSENEFDDFSEEILLPYKQSSFGPALAISQDGDLVYFGAAAGFTGQLFQIAEDNTVLSIDASFLEADSLSEDVDAVFFDLENDGDMDFYVVSGGNEYQPGNRAYRDRLYENMGGQGFRKVEAEFLSEYTLSGGSVSVADINNDGFSDLLVANRILPRNYPISGSSIILQNNQGQLSDVTGDISPELKSFGIVNELLASDVNNDGWVDILALGEWSEVGVFINDKGRFTNESEEFGVADMKGWWFSATEVDINGDGYQDYILGNIGMNTKFKASKEKPFRLYAHDFVSSGTLDVVLSNDYNGTYVPVRGRECSSQQMPFIAEKFETYSEFANASLVDIYDEGLESAYKMEINELGSYILINQEGKGFKKSMLPWRAQMFPILDGVAADFNADGLEDVLLVGNIYDMEVETPRLDARSGLILFSDGTENLTQSQSLGINGDVKSVATFTGDDSLNVIIGRNNDSALLYQFPLTDSSSF